MFHTLVIGGENIIFSSALRAYRLAFVWRLIREEEGARARGENAFSSDRKRKIKCATH